ncbi:hypothetical protein D3C77_519960 [compost metagenome]
MLIQLAVFNEEALIYTGGNDRLIFYLNRADRIATFFVGILNADVPCFSARLLAHRINIAAKIDDRAAEALLLQIVVNRICCIAFTD